MQEPIQKQPNWWQRRSGKGKVFIIVAGIIVVIAAISGGAAGGGEGSGGATATTVALAAATETSLATTTTAKVTTTTARPTTTTERVTTTTEPPTTTTTESEQAFKDSCEKASYKVISKNPDGHVGERYTFTGQILQIQEDESGTFMLLEITKDKYGWNDLVMAAWLGTADIYEDDVVTVWGECSGKFEYSTKIGGTNSVPGFLARYVEKAK